MNPRAKKAAVGRTALFSCAIRMLPDTLRFRDQEAGMRQTMLHPTLIHGLEDFVLPKLVGGLTILKNISQWEGWSHILWKIKNVWNHQPESLSERESTNNSSNWPMLLHSQNYLQVLMLKSELPTPIPARDTLQSALSISIKNTRLERLNNHVEDPGLGESAIIRMLISYLHLLIPSFFCWKLTVWEIDTWFTIEQHRVFWE